MGPQGAYLHTIVLLVSSTLPSYRGEKVEGYQHQAGHQGPQGKEEQHPQAAARWGSGSAIWGHCHLSSSPRRSRTAGSPRGGLASPVLSDLQWVEGRVQCVLGPWGCCFSLGIPSGSWSPPVLVVANPEAQLPGPGLDTPSQTGPL